MKTFYLSSAAEQSLLMIFLFLALIGSLFLLLTVFGRHRKKAKRYLHMSVFLLLFLFLYVLADAFGRINGEMEYRRLLQVPMWLLWCIVVGFYLLFLWEIIGLHRTKGQVLDGNSVKQAMDLLPEGICYFTSTGTVKLCNLQMYRLFRTLAGRDLQKLNELQEALKDCDGKTDVVRLSDERQTYLFPDGKVWRYRQNEVTAEDGNTYTETVFSDLSEQYHKNMELRKQTEKLKEISRELKRLSDNVLILTREKEVLAAKTQLHDQMGTGLAAVRQILQSQEAADISNAVKLLRQAVSAIKNDNEYPPERGEFEKLMQDADAIGAKVNVTGKLPESEEISQVFILAMRECLTNSVCHAGATKLSVEMAEEEKFFSVLITNNGVPPEKEVVPKGGLQNLYRYVLDCGGKMQIQSEPFFALTVTIPKAKEEKE